MRMTGSLSDESDIGNELCISEIVESKLIFGLNLFIERQLSENWIFDVMMDRNER